MQLSAAIAQYKIDYPYQKIRTKSLPDSISLDDEASCFEQLANLLLPDGIISGMAVSVDGSNNLTVQPGVWQIDRLQYSTTVPTTFALDAQDPTLSRYDVVYADTSNNLYLLSGTLSSSPVAPVIPDDTLLICSALITPTSVTVSNPPPTDFVDTFSAQTIGGVKTFTVSPQVPNGVSGQDAVAFNQLSAFLAGAKLNNGIGSTGGGYYGIGGSPLNQNTTLNLSTYTLTFTQGLLMQGDYTAYYNANDRAIIDAGYFRNNQWFRPYNAGQNYVNGDMVSSSANLFFVGQTVTSAAVDPFTALRPGQFSSSVSDSTNIATYLAWNTISGIYTPAGDNLLWLEITFNTATNTTFPFFSYTASIFQEDWFEFSVGVDNNAYTNHGYHAKYKFTTAQIATSNTWYEMMATYKSHDFVTRNPGQEYVLHIDVAFNSANGSYEFRGRHTMITGSSAYQDYTIEFSKSASRQFFGGMVVTPSNYWPILNNSITPNTQLPNWKGTDSSTIPLLQGATTGGGPQVSYAFQTSGLDNYTSDFSGSYTSLSKISKGYADSTYLTSASLGSYLLKSGGTMTGNLILNADPSVNLGAATKQYVDNSIANSAVYFGAGTFIPGGPTFGNPVGTIDNPYVFGNISALSIATTATGATFNQTTTNANITTFQYNGTPVAAINFGGALYGAGMGAFAGASYGFLAMGTGGSIISRSMADGVAAFRIAQLNTSSTGNILELDNQFRNVMNFGLDGSLIQQGLSKSVSGVAIGYNMVNGLRPSANGDVLAGLAIAPVFGKSRIASFVTLVGGSGYPNGTYYSNLSGGTGLYAVAQCTVAGGIVTGISLIDGGINYTPGDVLSIVITVNGTPVGSGGTITVNANTSYTGTFNYSLSVLNGPSLFAAGTATYGSLIVPVGVTYTGTTPGTIWQDGTHLYIYINGTVKQII
jgi:hypothetical protein